MSSSIVQQQRRAEIENRLTGEAERKLGRSSLERLRCAPAHVRAVQNGWPVLFAHATEDLIFLFALIVERDERLTENWSAFLDMAALSDWQDEFLSAVTSWGKRVLNIMQDQIARTGRAHPERNARVRTGRFWDEVRNGWRGLMNPRVADELVTLALCCRGFGGRIRRGALPPLRRFYSTKWHISVTSDRNSQMLITKVLGQPRTLEWCARYPFTASLSGVTVPRVVSKADDVRISKVLSETPPRHLNDLRDAHFSTI